MRELTIDEEEKVVGGEAITLAAILAIMAIGIVSVVCYKFFSTNSGKATLPGGFSFQWSK